MSGGWCRAAAKGIWLIVQVAPNAKRNEVTGIHGDALKIRLRAQPVEGKANEALIGYLAAALDIPRSAISILHGHAGRRKTIEIGVTGLDCDAVGRLLLGAPA